MGRSSKLKKEHTIMVRRHKTHGLLEDLYAIQYHGVMSHEMEVCETWRG